MKRILSYTTISVALVIAGLIFFQENDAEDPSQEATVYAKVSPDIVMENTLRLGLNLGGWNSWGSEEFMNNVLMNPGFEEDLDRVIVIVTKTNSNSFFDDKNWGYDDNYWNGAAYYVQTGRSAGATGTITKSLRAGEDNLPQYSAEPLPALSPRDVVVITKISDTNPIPLWSVPNYEKGPVLTDKSEKRPGSPGKQSVVLSPTKDLKGEINYFLDADSVRHGKMLIVSNWKLSFWAKSDLEATKLHVRFLRFGSNSAFLIEDIPLTTSWQQYTFDISQEDNGPEGTIMLSFSSEAAGARLWLDDISLGPIATDPKLAFRKELVDSVKELHPSFLRDTQGQLGDTFENRVAETFARKSLTTRAYAGARNLGFLYSLHEFFELCKAVKANPWIIVPLVFTESEARELGSFLAEHANKNIFPEVIIEFGNESWNWLFRSYELPYPDLYGPVVDKLSQSITETAGTNINLVKVVNGQEANPSITLEFLKDSHAADILAIADYFFTTLDINTPENEVLKTLFSQDLTLIKQEAQGAADLDKGFAIYEINFGTVEGNAPALLRDSYVASALGGAALAKRLMECMFVKAQPQMVFNFTQYDYRLKTDYVKIWGITRDFLPTKRFRPTGLAVSMLNSVMGGSLHHIQSAKGKESIIANLTMAAFKNGKQWNAAVVNANPNPQTIQIEFPEDDSFLPNTFHVLNANSPFDTNEDAELVKIVHEAVKTVEGRQVKFTVPAWGFAVLNGLNN
jgi:hypothetical protein